MEEGRKFKMLILQGLVLIIRLLVSRSVENEKRIDEFIKDVEVFCKELKQ